MNNSQTGMWKYAVIVLFGVAVVCALMWLIGVLYEEGWPVTVVASLVAIVWGIFCFFLARVVVTK